MRLHFAQEVGVSAARFATRPAVIGDRGSVSYGELWRRAGRIADALSSSGVLSGQHVVLAFRNDPDFVEVYLGCAIAGIAAACVYPDYGWSHVLSVAERTRAALLISDATERTAEVVAEACKRTRHRLQWVSFASSESVPDGALPIARWLEAAQPHSRPAPDPGTILVTLCSSGTTGPAKLVPRSHERFLRASQRFGELWGCRQQVCFGVASLITHAAALGWGVHPVLMSGGTLVIPRDRRPAAVHELFRASGVEVSFMVPSQARALLGLFEDDPDLPRPLLSQLILGGETLDPELAARLQGSVARRIQNTYGMSEGICTATAIDGLQEILHSSIGRPCLEDDAVRIVDLLNGSDVTPGEVGELWLRSGGCMEGYLDQPSTACFSPDGFLRTGDLTRDLGAGCLSFVGRVKNVINRSGLKIYPELVENALAMHPQISAAAVVGMPDLRVGECVCAAIVTHTSRPLTLADINQYLVDQGNGRLLHLDHVLKKEQLPSTPNGKVDRRAVAGLFSRQGSATGSGTFRNADGYGLEGA